MWKLKYSRDFFTTSCWYVLSNQTKNETMKKCLFISLAFASTIALSFMGCNNSANINEEDLQTIPSSKIGLKDIGSYWHLKEKLYVVHKICIVESLPTADSAQIAEDAINRDEDATYDLFESVNTTIPYQRITTKDKTERY